VLKHPRFMDEIGAVMEQIERARNAGPSKTDESIRALASQ
jgi:hypothetical protein